MFHPDDMPDITPVIELTRDEMYEPSGIVDTITDREGNPVVKELNNLEAIELLEGSVHGAQGVFIKGITGTDRFTVYSRRPTELQAKELYKLRADFGIDPENLPHAYSWQPESQH